MTSISLYLFLLGAFIWAGCGGSEPAAPADSAPTEATTPSEEASSNRMASPTADVAVCLWNEAGLRSGPGRTDVKWITAVKFGETVTLPGQEETLEKEARTYVEMELADRRNHRRSGRLGRSSRQGA